MRQAISLLDGVEGVGISHLTYKDVVRHELVERIVRAYDKASPPSDTYSVK